MRNEKVLLVVCAPAILCLAGLGLAQNTNSGDIRGTVTDPTGALVPDATVTVLNVDTGVMREYHTNAAGLYDTVSIIPGRYRVTFYKEGFSRVVRDGVTLEVGAPFTVDARLTVGSAQQQVEVSAESLLLKTETAEQASDFHSDTMAELPNVTRSWTNMTKMLPGVTGSGAALTVNGSMPNYANFMADGASVTLPHSANLDVANFEALEEVQIVTSTFSAQYGTGAVVYNQISKSGTNQWHGSGYEFVQNTALNARNFFSPSVPIIKFNNFGGSVAGPIRKDKAFFYANLEKIVKDSLSYTYYTFPTTDMLAGNFSNPIFGTIYDPASMTNGSRTAFPGNVIPASRMDPLAAAVQKYFPALNLPGYANNLLAPLTSTSPSMKYFGRGDYNFSEANRLTESFTRTNSRGHTPSPECPIDCSAGPTVTYQAQISDVWTISPTTVNEFRIGYVREDLRHTPDTLGLGFPQKLGWTYAEADMFPAVTIGGPVGATNMGTPTNNLNVQYAQNGIDPSDSVTLIRGKHILHFGGEYLFFRDNSTYWGNLQSGNFNFTGVYTSKAPFTAGGLGYADFLLGQVASWGATNSPMDGDIQKQPQLFVQDDFKVAPHLTVNLGLRYQIMGGWYERYNQMGTFDPTIINPATNTLGAMWFAPNNGRRSLEATVYNIVLPRVGFAWSPKSNWVVRGGFGIYGYGWSEDTYAGNAEAVGSSHTGSLSESTQVQPLFFFSSTKPPLNYVGASKAPDSLNGHSAAFFSYHTPVPRNYQWSLSIQREVPGGMLAETAYTGNHTNGLANPVDINQVPYNKLGVGVAQNNRPYPQFLSIGGAAGYDNAISNYDSLQLSLKKKRFSQGLSFEVNYTWSKMLSEQDSGGASGAGGSQIYQSSYFPGNNYAFSNLHRSQMFKGDLVYQLPIGKGKKLLSGGGPLDWVLGGWQASTIFIVEAGSRYTPVMGTTNLSGALSGSWFANLVGDPSLANPTVQKWFNLAAFAQPAPFTFGNAGRNILVGPLMSGIDFTMAKSFVIPRFERGRLQIRMDATNVINHPSFSNPSSSIGTPSAGVITGTSVGGRTVQLGARLSF